MTHFGPILGPSWDHAGAHTLGEGRGNGLDGSWGPLQMGLRSGGSEGQGSEIKGELTNWGPKWVPQIANLTSGDPIQGRAHSEGALFRPLKRVESTANRDQTGPGSGRNQ